MFLGSDKGITSIDAMDLDQIHNMVFVGKTTDSDLLGRSSTTSALIAYLPFNSFDYTWAKSLSISNQEVCTLKFQPSGERILLMFRLPLTIVIFSSANG